MLHGHWSGFALHHSWKYFGGTRRVEKVGRSYDRADGMCIEIGMLDTSDCEYLHSELPTMVPTVAQRRLQFGRCHTNENLAQHAAEEPQRFL